MDTQKPIRVMIVDDHDRVREGLRILLDCFDDLECAGEAIDAESAILLYEREHPDVTLMDLVLPGKDGIFATSEILKRDPNAKIIALTSFNISSMTKRILKAGVMSYLKKNVGMDELATTIRDAYKGKGTIAPEALQELKDTDELTL
ncbi:response regulator transcription factor [Phototrophicus methaneseepsis]|uniref:Response regulator transcription factor n=1 Tax=Phototrophicus methaneseepsis TaxID=2710758 RepID=A0A7S8EAC9_9CHLR|nr:response regulator transcription factor [Phototrophicus methaneseepsis]QPC83332.1 response regulator transcription factor [Phototrophicus methaneseepsis]